MFKAMALNYLRTQGIEANIFDCTFELKPHLVDGFANENHFCEEIVGDPEYLDRAGPVQAFCARLVVRIDSQRGLLQ